MPISDYNQLQIYRRNLIANVAMQIDDRIWVSNFSWRVLHTLHLIESHYGVAYPELSTWNICFLWLAFRKETFPNLDLHKMLRYLKNLKKNSQMVVCDPTW